MARYISYELSALIRGRTHAKGRVTKAQNRIDRLKREIELSEEGCRVAQEEVDRLSAEIKRLAPNLDQNQIKATKKISPRRWRTGALNELLIRFLKEASGELRTSELMVMTARELGVPLTPQEYYDRHRDTIRRQLSRWASKGFIDRLNHPKPGEQEEARWRWRHWGPS